MIDTWGEVGAGAVIKNCTISENVGGGVGGRGFTLLDCTIVGNSAGEISGVQGAGYTLVNCIISNNSGGEFVISSNEEFDRNPNPQCVLNDCVITENSASLAAVGSWGGQPLALANCVIAGNFCAGYLGAFVEGSVLTNCTIAGNSGGGVIFGFESQSTLENCILWNSGNEEIVLDEPPLATVEHSCIRGSWSGAGNTDAYPEFVDLLNGDYHLRNGSPCIDTGLVPAAPTEDIEGRERPGSDGLVDMGAYESLPEYEPDNEEWKPSRLDLVYVRADVPEGGDGASWESALSSIGKALLTTSRNGEVWVARGAYHERVFMMEGVAIYGGFLGNEETREQRDWVKNQTIIDADGSGSAVVGADDAILDGFTITGGGNEYSSGGGVYCSWYSPTLINCIITGNTAYSGGGVYCGDESFMELIDCTITGNTARGVGGGLYCGGESLPTLTNCIISGNSTEWYGGGVYCRNSYLDLINCTITGNSAAEGGGVYCDRNSSPVLTNCIVWNNEVAIIDRSTPLFTYSNIAGGLVGAGNIDADPLFVDALNGDFHLQNGSPCIDTGFVPDAPDTDAERRSRPGTDGLVDMGAYESPPEYTSEGWTPTPTPTATPRLAPPIEQLPILASPEAAGIRPLTPDVSLWAQNGGGGKVWRPACDTLSNGNAIVLGGMRKEPGWTGDMHYETAEREMRDMIAIFSPAGELLEPARTAFFTDAGEPWEDTIHRRGSNVKIYDICSDTTGGRSGDRYVVLAVANPDEFSEAFPGYPPDPDYHSAVQIVSNGGDPETKLINFFGDYVSEPGRIHNGSARFLSNGNIVVNFDDQTQNQAAKAELYGSAEYGGNVAGAVILGPDGSIVKPPFAICNPSGTNSRLLWGLTSSDEWFAIRYQDGVDGPTIVAFDNDGNELGGGQGRVYPAIDIPELEGPPARLRGDSQDLEAVGDLLFLSTHRAGDYKGFLTKLRVDENGVTVLKTAEFTDHPLSTFEHNADIGVDSQGNLIVMWQDQSWERFQEGRWEMLARMFNVDLEPLTPSFCMFEVGNNTDTNEIDPILGPGRTKQCRIAMNDEIIIAIAQTNEVPYGDPVPLLSGPGGEWHSYTYIARVLENPFGPAAVKGWELY